MRRAGFAVALAALVLASGCSTLTLTQECSFIDSKANVVTVEYLRSDKEHVSTFVSPGNGRELDFKTRLAVRVWLPDGTRFLAWQTMNFLKNGTLYKANDGEFMFLASGVTCSVWYKAERQTENGPVDDYAQIFGGMMIRNGSAGGGAGL